MFTKLITFNRTLWKSMFSLKYYHDVVKAPGAFSFKFFWAFSLFLGILLSITMSFTIIPPVNEFLTKFKTRATTLYPENLIIDIKDGKVTTNVTEPFHFSMPLELFTDTPPAISDQKQLYLVTIDTHASVNDYEHAQSLIFVTADSTVIKDERGGYRVYPLKDVPSVTIDKALIDKGMTQLLPFLTIVPIVLIVFIAGGLLLMWPLIRLVSLVFLSLPLFIANNFFDLNLGYKKIYQIGLHSLTLPLFIQIGMFAFNLNSPIPFFNVILFFLYNLAIFSELKSNNYKT